MDGICLHSELQSLSFTLTSCVQTLAGSSLDNGKPGRKACPLRCFPLMWKVNNYRWVTCKLLVRAIILADKRAPSWMGRREGEVPWSLLSQYNVLDLIEAGKTEQNTSGVLEKSNSLFLGWVQMRYSVSPTFVFFQSNIKNVDLRADSHHYTEFIIFHLHRCFLLCRPIGILPFVCQVELS